MKKLLLIINVCIFALLLTGFTLKGGISYSVDEARTISFDKVEKRIDISPYRKYFVDVNNIENMELISKKKFKYKNRYITWFSTKKYAIVYKNDKNKGFYYDINGKLELIEFIYPKKSVRYDKNGQLDSISLTLPNREDFIFDADKKLNSHWIGDNCYDENGTLIMTRNEDY